LLAGFWCWRLYRQLGALGRVWPHESPRLVALNAVLVSIFVVQGPILGALIVSSS